MSKIRNKSLYEILYKIRWKIRKKYEGYLAKKVMESVQKKEPSYGLYIGNDRVEKIIISMASYNMRYNTISTALKSLLFQTTKPDKILVWLDEKIKENEITDEMKKYCEYGVEFYYTNDQMKSHKKYIYAMKEYPKDIIITVDDDVAYPPDLVETLLLAYKKNPDCICARRLHRARFDAEKNLRHYSSWFFEYKGVSPSYLYWPTGIGGVLYPAGCMPDKAFDMQTIRECCLNADDLWLKIMGTLAGVKVVWAKNKIMQPKSISGSQEVRLNKNNVVGGENDLTLLKLRKLFPEVFDFLSRQE